MRVIGELVGGRYRAESRLGSGGMGKTFRAIDTTSGRDVVLKVPRLDDLEGRQSETRVATLLKRFNREAEVLCEFRHPNVPRGFGHGYHRGTPYLAMEFVNGTTLTKFMEDNPPIPIPAVVAVGTQIASALSAVHGLGIVHRDLKPDNVILSQDGVAFVIDFGIVKLLDPEASKYTELNHFPGTRQYMAPEQFKSGVEVGPPADLYALGCVMYLLLTGHSPFIETTGGPTFRDQHLGAQPAAPTRSGEPIPDDLTDLVLQLLAKKPEKRPASAEEFIRRTNHHLPALGAVAPVPTIKPDPTRKFRHLDDVRPPEASPRKLDPPHSRPAVSRRGPALSRKEIPVLIAAARAQAAGGDVFSAREELETLLSRASRRFGGVDPVAEEIRNAISRLGIPST